MKPARSLTVAVLSIACTGSTAAQCEIAEITDHLFDHPHNQHGKAVAISDDGRIALVGAPGTGSDAGAVYVYERPATTWLQTQVLTGSPGDRFGASVAIEPGGSPNALMVGAPSAATGGAVFVYSGGFGSPWSFQELVSNPNTPAVGDDFGWSVALSFTGYAVIGARGETNTVHGGVGSAYVFQESFFWVMSVELDPSPWGFGTADAFGTTVGITSAAVAPLGVVFAGDPRYDVGSTGDVGTVFSFDVLGNGINAAGFTGAADSRFGGAMSTTATASGDIAVAIGAARKDTGAGADAGAVHVYTLDPGTLVFGTPAVLEPDDAAPGRRFGRTVALVDGRLLVGDSAAFGHAYVFEGSGLAWSQTETLAPDIAEVNSIDLGRGLALADDYAFVGAPLDDDWDTDSGATWVYEKGGSAWIERQKLAAGKDKEFADMAEKVALSGSTAIFSEVKLEEQLHVFELDGSGWTELPELTPSQGPDVRFSDSVAIDGDRIAVGAPEGDGVVAETGAVFVFERSGGTWSETAVVFAADGQGPAGFDVADEFGYSVALEGDRLVVGSHQDDAAASAGGSVYVFEEQLGTWTEMAELTASDAANFDQLGASVALSEEWVLAGAPRHQASQGAAYLYREFLPGFWFEETKLVGSDTGVDDDFGNAVAIEGDLAIVGARSHTIGGDGGAGAAYVFELLGTSWEEVAKLTHVDSSQFGRTVDIDGERLVVGSYEGAHVFERQGGSWIEVQTLSPGDVADSVAVEGDTVILGASSADTSGENSGAMFVYSLSGQGVASLTGAPASISLSDGGSHFLSLGTCAEHAGRLYWVWGTASGTSPPFPVGAGLLLPINVVAAGGGLDAYWDFTIKEANNGILENTLGVLDGAGDATARLNVPPGTNPALAGLTLHHAYTVYEGTDPVFVSDAAAVALVP